MKLPVRAGRWWAVAGAAGFNVGVATRRTLSGDLTGWQLFAEGHPINRRVSMNVDRPRVGRWRW